MNRRTWKKLFSRNRSRGRSAALPRPRRLRVEQLQPRLLLSADLLPPLELPGAYGQTFATAGNQDNAGALRPTSEPVGREITSLLWQGARVDAVKDQWVVRFADSFDFKDCPAVLRSQSGVSPQLVRRLGVSQFAVLQAPSDQSGAMQDWAKGRPEVLYVEPNFVSRVAQTKPDDTRFDEQWGLNNLAESYGVFDADIDAPEAWDRETGSSSVVIGVIDTGIDYTHPDLDDNIWSNPYEVVNGVDDDGNGYVDDIRGWDFVNEDNDPMDTMYHGTHVAGIIGAIGDNDRGVTGVMWNVKLMALKAGNADGVFAHDDTIAAIQYATWMKTHHGINVVATNNSYYGHDYDAAVRDAIRAADNEEILFVACSGNDDGEDSDSTPHYPASYGVPNIIAVAATDNYDDLALFSNYGATSVDLAAPGDDVLSTLPRDMTHAMSLEGLSTYYDKLDGTSMAAPHVAGVVGLLAAAEPSLSASEIKDAILDSVDPLSNLSGLMVSGGRLNAFGATLIATAPHVLGPFAELNPFGDWSKSDMEFGTDDDIDAVMFALDNGGMTRVRALDPSGNTDPGVLLWNLDDGRFAEMNYDDGTGNNRAVVSRTLDAFTRYQMEIFNEGEITGSGSYTADIDGPDQNIYDVSLDENGDGSYWTDIQKWDADYFRIVAPESAFGLTVHLAPNSGLDGVLTLYNAQGEKLDRTNSAGAGGDEWITFDEVVGGRTYYLRVGSVGYASTGNYAVTVDFDLALSTERTTADGEMVWFHDGSSPDVQYHTWPVPAPLETRKDAYIGDWAMPGWPGIDVDSFYVSVPDGWGGVYTFAAARLSGDVDPVLALYDGQTGEMLGFDDNSGPGNSAALTLTLADGKRYIVAVADDDHNGTGDVSLTAQAPVSATPFVPPIDEYGRAGPNNVPLTDELNSCFFELVAPDAANGELQVVVTPTAIAGGAVTLDADVVLFDASGNVLDRAIAEGVAGIETLSISGVVPGESYYLTVLPRDYNTRGYFDLDVQFGMYTGSIAGTVYNDGDADGERGPGEDGLDGWTVYIDEDIDGQYDMGVEPAVLTDSVGCYLFEGRPLSGFNYVRLELETGWTRTEPEYGYHYEVLTLSNPDRVDDDFGVYHLNRVRGTVYEDQDGDGVQDAGEPAFSGVTVFVDVGAVGLDAGDPQDTSDASGQYLIHDVPAGTYQVTVDPPFAYEVTQPASGAYSMTFKTDQARSGIQFGLYRPRDFGDAPDCYHTTLAANGAYHTVLPGFYMGAGVDDELDGKPTADADGDDTTGADDEDGVSFTTLLVPAGMATIEVVVSNAGILDGWIDFNGDGTFGGVLGGGVERIFGAFGAVVLPGPANVLNFAVPAGAAIGDTYARFRFTGGGIGVPDGYGFDGEVEDYKVFVGVPIAGPSVELGDVQPDPRQTEVTHVSIVFSKAVTGFDLADLVLTRNEGSNLLPGSGATLTTTDHITWTLGNLSGVTCAVGSYALVLAAPGSQIADTEGHPLARGDTETWVFESFAMPIEAAAGVRSAKRVAAFCDPWDPGSPTDPEDFQARIDWGDSSTSAGTIRILDGDPASFEVLGTHTYARSSAFRSVDADGGNGPLELVLTSYDLGNPRALHLKATNSSSVDTLRNVCFVQQFVWDATDAANKAAFAWNNAQRCWELGAKTYKTWGVLGQNSLMAMDRDMVDTPLSLTIANGNAAAVEVTDSLPAIGLGDFGPNQAKDFTLYIGYPYSFRLELGVYLVAARGPFECDVTVTLSKPSIGRSRVLTTTATVVTPALGVWDGRKDDGTTGADAKWPTATNWAGDQAPQAGNSLLFPAGAAQMANTNDLPAGTAFHSLALAGGGYTIGGAQIGLSAGIVNKATAAAENVLGFGIRLDAPQTFQNLSRSALTINGPIVSQGNALTIDGPGPIVVAGAISGLVPLQKAGPGTTVLTGRNTYSGGTTVTAGTLVAAHADALPAGGSLTIGPGGTVVLAAGISAASAGEAPAKVLASPVSAATGFVTVPMSIGQITDTAASATNTAPPTSQGMGVQRQTPITMAVQVQPAADPTPVGSMQVSTEGGDAAVFPPPSTSNSAAVTKPVVKLGPAFSAQLKAHDAALQAAVSRSRTDLSWLWALEETWSRRPWPKKNADAVAAVDQGLAGLPG